MEISTMQVTNDDNPFTLRILGRMAKHQQHLADKNQQETSFITTPGFDAIDNKINTVVPSATELDTKLLYNKQ